MSFRKDLDNVLKGHQMYFLLEDMSDNDIFEFIKTNVFHGNLNQSFKEVKKNMENAGYHISSMIPEAEQLTLWNIFQKYKSSFICD